MCRKIEGKPFTSPVSVPLPAFRLNSEVPKFQSVGLDYCRPVHVKDRSRNGSVEAWICLFSCRTSRIHLELVPDLTTDAFIRALRRFIGKRETPSVSDSE